jgi:ABC-2 type transport system permease protein
MRALWALVRTDLGLYLADKRTLLMHVAAPIIIAAFFGYLFSDRNDDEPGKIPIAVADLDRSPMSKDIVTALGKDAMLAVSVVDEAAGLAEVRRGKQHVLIVIPSGFGTATGPALFQLGARPEIVLHYDPSQGTSLQVVRGLLAQSVMQIASAATLTGDSPALDDLQRAVDGNAEIDDSTRSDLKAIFDTAARLNQRNTAAEPSATPDGNGRQGGLTVPYTLKELEAGASDKVPYNSFAHSFAGMSVQFVLFAGITFGVGLLDMRRAGLWRRLRASPLSRSTLLLSRLITCSLAALIIMVVVYSVAMLVFGVRIQGSLPGFAAVLLAFCIMTAAFGLFIAAFGKTPEATRGLSTFVVLLLVMLGGAWIPTFTFPAWMQRITAYIPTRWAIDGLDAMTWRGLDFSAAVQPTLLMLGFSAVCLAVAVKAFKWEE